MLNRTTPLALLGAAAIGLGLTTHPGHAADEKPAGTKAGAIKVSHRTVQIDGLDIFYREAGPKDAPAILLLHGFPTSSQMFRNLIPALADEFRVVAPDYPGFGHSSMPPRDKFAYTFDNLANVIDEVHREGRADEVRPVRAGLRRAGRLSAGRQAPGAGHAPSSCRTGTPTTRGSTTTSGSRSRRTGRSRRARRSETPCAPAHLSRRPGGSTRTACANPERVSPDGAAHDQFLLDRQGNDEIQLDLFLSYGSNPPLYPKWQEYFRKHQPPMLIVWGKNDQIFPAAGRRAVQAGPEDARVPPARRRPLRPRRQMATRSRV